jgi:hypothetical protein
MCRLFIVSALASTKASAAASVGVAGLGGKRHHCGDFQGAEKRGLFHGFILQ